MLDYRRDNWARLCRIQHKLGRLLEMKPHERRPWIDSLRGRIFVIVGVLYGSRVWWSIQNPAHFI